MTGRNRKAFTLIELVVVVVIIGTIIGLLVPALLGARESSRRTQCTNNQKQLATAIIDYDTAKKHLPGYANQVGPSTAPVAIGCMPTLFPYLDRNDLWQGGWNTGASNAPVVTLNQFVCPDDTRTKTYSLSYVVNVGPTLPDFTPANEHGVFTNRVPVLIGGTPPPTTPTSVSLSDIRSPTRRALLSESRSMGLTWQNSHAYSLGAVAAPTPWMGTSYICTVAGTSGASQPAWPIGGGTVTDGSVTWRPATRLWSNDTTALTDLGFATANLAPGTMGFVWPAAGSVGIALPPIHPGIVIVTFCDGHVESLSADADCSTYDCSNVQ